MTRTWHIGVYCILKKSVVLILTMSSAVLPYPISEFPKSKIRRKPIFTYKSPSANDVDPLITLPARCGVPTMSPESAQTNFAQNAGNIRHPPRKKNRTTDYSLPLYHPSGQLALSLPPLNPTEFGLPLLNISEEPSQGSSRRFREFLQDADEGMEILVPTVSSIAAVAASEMKRAGPQKRRLGGGNGKRRRKAADSGDAMYPVKRTRLTRGGVGDENELDIVQAQVDDAPVTDGPIDRRSERRSTRSKTKRRGSSEVESVEDHPVGDPKPVTEEIIKDSAGLVPERMSGNLTEIKEEGEIEG